MIIANEAVFLPSNRETSITIWNCTFSNSITNSARVYFVAISTDQPLCRSNTPPCYETIVVGMSDAGIALEIVAVVTE